MYLFDILTMVSTKNIREYAFELGFDSVRITGAAAFPEAERVIKERIAEGLMDGLPCFQPSGPMCRAIPTPCYRARNRLSPWPYAI
jgi:hypothetical protein